MQEMLKQLNITQQGQIDGTARKTHTKKKQLILSRGRLEKHTHKSLDWDYKSFNWYSVSVGLNVENWHVWEKFLLNFVVITCEWSDHETYMLVVLVGL